MRRTAGPLGRLFGFEFTIGRFSFAFNAGWYVFFINWQGLGFIHMATKPLQVEWYVCGVSK